MSDVKVWKLKGFLPGVEGECKAVFQPEVVLAEDYTALQLRLAAIEARSAELERVLGGMLFAFDDGVGQDWSAPLLDHARKQCKTVEYVAQGASSGDAQ